MRIAQANLARFKCPRLIEFVDALPRNATGKIHKPTLRKNFSALKADRQSGHCFMICAGTTNEKARRFITGGLLYQKPIRGSQYIRGNP